MENTSKSTALVPVTFPNGNSIVGPSVLEYAKRYQTFLNKTAESILALTETVYEARTNLPDDEFEQFKEEVGLKSKATVSKFLAIGEKSYRLKNYADRLPHAWTTLYRLVQLSDDDFSSVEAFINPDMTAGSINKILNPVVQSPVKDLPDLKLYFGNLEFHQRKRFLIKLTRLMQAYQVRDFKTSGEFGIEVRKMRGMSAAWILKFPKGHEVTDDNDADIAA